MTQYVVTFVKDNGTVTDVAEARSDTHAATIMFQRHGLNITIVNSEPLEVGGE